MQCAVFVRVWHGQRTPKGQQAFIRFFKNDKCNYIFSRAWG